MRVLLDTHCWLWMAGSPERLSQEALAIVETTEHQLLLSAASGWEIAIKYLLGKLPMPESPERFIPTRLHTLRTEPLSIELAHAVRAGGLPRHHDDPFDRMLVAQARAERMALVSNEAAFDALGVTRIW